jgi:hypothetical protein
MLPQSYIDEINPDNELGNFLETYDVESSEYSVERISLEDLMESVKIYSAEVSRVGTGYQARNNRAESSATRFIDYLMRPNEVIEGFQADITGTLETEFDTDADRAFIIDGAYTWDMREVKEPVFDELPAVFTCMGIIDDEKEHVENYYKVLNPDEIERTKNSLEEKDKVFSI